MFRFKHIKHIYHNIIYTHFKQVQLKLHVGSLSFNCMLLGFKANMYTGYIPLGKFFCLHSLIIFKFACLKMANMCFKGRVTDESSSSFSSLLDVVTFSFTIIKPFSFKESLKKIIKQTLYIQKQYTN